MPIFKSKVKSQKPKVSISIKPAHLAFFAFCLMIRKDKNRTISAVLKTYGRGHPSRNNIVSNPINTHLEQLFAFAFYPLLYSASATTSFTSGIIRFIIPSMPVFRVIIEEGQPLHEPCSISFTVPLSNPLKLIAPPSISTAGFT